MKYSIEEWSTGEWAVYQDGARLLYIGATAMMASQWLANQIARDSAAQEED